MSIEENKVLARRFHQVWNTGNVSAIDDLAAAGYVLHCQAIARAPGGRDALKTLIADTRAAFPDYQQTLEVMIAEGDRVAICATAQGTHRGAFAGHAPTGRAVRLQMLAMHQIEDRRIVESWCTWDTLAILRDLGLAATPDPISQASAS